MNTVHPPKNPQVKHRNTIIKYKVDGVMRTFLPAPTLTPGLLRVEQALSEALKLLRKSPERAKTAMTLFFDTIQQTHASQRPLPKKPNGKTDYWPLREYSATTVGSPFELALLSAQLSNVINDPYGQAGKALVRVFRLLALTAPEFFETFGDFKIRKYLWPQFEKERRKAFESYLQSCNITMQTPGFPVDFKATFDRFQAVWLNAPLQAQDGFVFNTSIRNQRRNAQINHKYALITSKINGKTHSFLPATYIRPEIFRFEKSLTRTVSRINKATREATTLKKQMSKHVKRAFEDKYCLTFTDTGNLQFWKLAQGGVVASKTIQMRTFYAKKFAMISTTEYEKNAGAIAEEMTRQEAKLFLAAGQSMAESFRLFEAVAAYSLELLAIFVIDNKLPFVQESERCATFNAYIRSSQKTLMTSYDDVKCEREAVIASFDRFTALWLSLPAPAKSAFILAL